MEVFVPQKQGWNQIAAASPRSPVPGPRSPVPGPLAPVMIQVNG